ncbi:hypothetical protein ACGFXC_35235 [Streptomyces sp. NPDC048507]|uniref:hypothetical protein n=1 Tax=Streptomyces sp. NPDC048507 TaxID=3365560 RepID=UPI003712DB90
MISEPELVGDPPGRAGDRVGGAEPVRRARSGEGGPRGRWWWALGGALAASAVWAGTLAVQERFSESAPPLAYRQTGNLCQEAPLATLGKLLGTFDPGRPTHAESPALDWAYCGYGTEWSEGSGSVQGRLLVELHRLDDPEPVFGVGTGLDPEMRTGGSADVQEVPGLGERALLTRHVAAPQLQVLDGGAVFTLALQSFGDGEWDEDAVAVAMIEDVRQLMARLHR